LKKNNLFVSINFSAIERQKDKLIKILEKGRLKLILWETNKYSLKTVPSAKDYWATLMK